MTAQSERTLAITLFGPPAIRFNSRTLLLPARTDTRSLLFYLLLDVDVFHPRKHIAHRLWPDETEVKAQTRLRRAMHRLARDLNGWPKDARPMLHRDRLYLRLQLPPQYSLDLNEFEQLRRAIEGLPPHDHRAGALLSRAIEVQAGPLLEGVQGAWVDARREGLDHRRQQHRSALATVAEQGSRTAPTPISECVQPTHAPLRPTDDDPGHTRSKAAIDHLRGRGRRAWVNAPRPFLDASSMEVLAEILMDTRQAIAMAGDAIGSVSAQRLPGMLEKGIEHLVDIRRDAAWPSQSQPPTLWHLIESQSLGLSDQQRTGLERLSLLPGAFAGRTREVLAPAKGFRASDSDSPGRAGETRSEGFRIPFAYRQFHRRRLRSRQKDLEAAQAAIRRHYIELVLSAGQESGTEAQADWMRMLLAESENIDAAMRQIEASGSADEALAFCSGVWVYWYVGGCGETERSWIRTVVDQGLQNGSDDRRRLASAAHGLGVLLYGEGELTAAADYLETSARLYRAEGVANERAAVLQHLALVLSTKGKLSEARRCRDESESLAEASAQPREAAILRTGLTRGHIERSAGRMRAAYSLFRHSEHAFQRAGKPDQQRMHALSASGEAALDLGMLRRAENLLRQALDIADEIGSRANASAILDSLGRLYSRQGQNAASRQALIRSLLIARELSEQSGVIISLCNLAEMEIGDLDVDKARFLLREAERLARRIGDREGMVYVALLVAECGVGAGDRRLIDQAGVLLRDAGEGDAFIGSAANASRLRALAWIASGSGDPARACEHWLASAHEHLARNDAYEAMRGLERLAFLQTLVGERDAANPAWALASGIRNAIGTPRTRFEERLLNRAAGSRIAEDVHVERGAGDLRNAVEALLRETKERFAALEFAEIRIEDWFRNGGSSS